MCGKSARTVPLGGGRQQTHGDDYTGTKLETADTAKSEPTEHRDGPRPSRITLKKAYTDGTIAVDMDPLSLLCRLATSVPPPRLHTIRYAGVLAPASPWRSRLALALVKDPASIARTLAAAGEATEVPCRSPGRGPPYWKSRVLRRQVLGEEDGGGGRGGGVRRGGVGRATARGDHGAARSARMAGSARRSRGRRDGALPRRGRANVSRRDRGGPKVRDGRPPRPPRCGLTAKPPLYLRSPRRFPQVGPAQLNVTVWLCPSSVVDSFDTRWFAAIDATCAAVRVTVCGWSDVPLMSRLSAPAAVSCAAVITAEWP